LGKWKNVDVEWKNGKYGYYLKVGDKNYSWSGENQPSWEEVEVYLGEQGQARKLGGGIDLVYTKYGWAMKKGQIYVSVPSHIELSSITREFAEELINQKKSKKGKK
jgi:topoisomerase IA-like protein